MCGAVHGTRRRWRRAIHWSLQVDLLCLGLLRESQLRLCLLCRQLSSLHLGLSSNHLSLSHLVLLQVSGLLLGVLLGRL